MKRVYTRILVRRDTTANWDAATGFVPMSGELIVYTDHKSKTVDGVTVHIPGVKVGSGNAYVQDLAFVGEDVAESLLSHINDSGVHVTEAEKASWRGKLNVDDNNEVENNTLILNRD